MSQQYAALIQQFGDGWQKADADAMVVPFAEDAVFIPAPFERPIKGRPAIAEYWKDIAFEQAEISFRFGEIFAAGPWFSTEFRCTFRRRRTGEPVDVRGALFCETAGGKISEMRMYWERRVGGTLPS
jgi:ketosteroid isomerase-like protein